MTIAGSDSGGGAGIQADIKTFAMFGVHGTSAVTCLTDQNPLKVEGIFPVPSNFVSDQIRTIFNEFSPSAVKTGMLYSKDIIVSIIRQLTNYRRKGKKFYLVVDPVMVSSSGKALLESKAVNALKELMRIADVITPNLDEVEALLGRKPKNIEEMRLAARAMAIEFESAVLLKGGHLKNCRSAADFLVEGKNEFLFLSKFLKGNSIHGTGCTMSAAITACLAKGLYLSSSVADAKEYISNAIFNYEKVGKHKILKWQ